MRVSCVIPTRNRQRLVLRAIASVLRQDRPCQEIVVVDDGSSDQTVSAIHSRFPMVRLLHGQGRGAGPARNLGVAACRGEVVMFLDSDDLWLASHVRLLLAALARSGASLAYGIARTVDRVNGTAFPIPEPHQQREGDCFEALLNWCFLVPSAVAVRRQRFLALGGFPPGSLAEDWLFFLRLAAHGDAFAFAGDQPVTVRRLHQDSQCCGQGVPAICQALEAIRSGPWPASRQRQVRDRFGRLRQWTESQGRSWTTVQEWYQALKQEKLV